MPQSAKAPPPPNNDLLPLVASNLRRLRAEQRLSLEALGKRSGVSRAMLGQIELGQSTPTVTVMWKIAQGLGVPFSALLAGGAGSQPSAPPETVVMRAKGARPIPSGTGAFTSRPLFPGEGSRVEFYEITMRPKQAELADAHPAGTVENIVVAQGALELELGGSVHKLQTGDAIRFAADRPHRYSNPGRSSALLYMVITYPEAGR